MVQKNKKIVVGLSGGVDSAIALVILKKQGWLPIGVSLKLPVWKSRQNLLRENTCCTKESLDIAKKVCKELGVPYHIFDVRIDFQKKVIDYFVSELKNNKTPNPCVVCNRHLKFKKLFEFAKKAGIKYVATGHYAKIRKLPATSYQLPEYQLLRAKDREKDQSYALCFLPQKWLENVVFPLGNCTKQEVYEMAKDEGFDFLVKKKQSQDFCFVAGKSLPHFLKEKIGVKKGRIVDVKGNVLGEHKGLHFYTIGQRKGINLSGGPYFVKSFDTKSNILIVARDKKEVCQKEVLVSPFHFISGHPPEKKIKVMAKIRYRQLLAKATLYPPKDNKLRLVFDKPQRAVTPGQFAVFYLGEVCLGGGKIL